jgi:pSer/pThr/pTyr-binding forkhead associated (FHA) protein
MSSICLVIEEDGREKEKLVFSQETDITIGRGQNNVVILNSSNVSRNHCRIYFSEGNWSIDDLGSTNGIQVNEESRQSAKLCNNDVISVRPFDIKIGLAILNHDETLTENEGSDLTIFDSHDAALLEITDKEEDVKDGTIFDPSDTDIVESNIKQCQNFVLITNGLSAGNTFPLLDETFIGSSEQCNIRLKDQGVKFIHLNIQGSNGRYRFRTIDNASVLRNGKQVDNGKLKDQDVLTIAGININLRLTNESKTKRKHFGLFKVTPKLLLVCAFILVLLPFVVVSIKNTSKTRIMDENRLADKELVTLPSNTGLPSSASKNESQDEKEVEASLDEKRQLSKLIYQAEQFIAEDALEKASHRIKAALQLGSNDAKALQLQNQIVEKLENKRKIEEKKLVGLQAFKDKAKDNFERINKMLSEEDFSSARELVEEINKNSEGFDNVIDIQNKIIDLRKVINDHEKEKRKNLVLKKDSFEEQLGTLKQDMELGLAAYKENNLYQAVTHMRKANASPLDVSEKIEIRKHLSEIERTLISEIKVSFEKAESSKKSGDNTTALVFYDRVLRYDPSHSEAKKQFEKLFPAQEKEAKHLYQEGLVYEGINNLDKAIANWKNTLKVLPLEDKEYYIKSKRKLSEYGIK